MKITTGSTIIKNSVLNIFNAVFMIITNWGISIWVARQLGPDTYGVFTQVLWFSGIFSWIVGMGLIHSVTKFIAEYSGKSDPSVMSSVVSYVLKIEVAFSVLITGILLVFKTTIADYFFTPSQSFYFFLAFLGIVPGVITAIFSATIQGIQKFEYFTIANMIIAPCSLGCKIIVLALGKGIDGLLWVMLIFSCVNSIFYYFVLRHEGIRIRMNSTPDKSVKKRVWKFNASVIPIMICDKIIWDKSEIFFLGRFCVASQIGFFHLGYNVIQKFGALLPSTFWQVLFPAMSSFFGTGDERKMKRAFYSATRYLAFVAFPFGIGGIILAQPFIHYFYGAQYLGAVRPMRILLAASMITNLCNPGAAVLYGYERQAFIYKLGSVMAIVNIGLNLYYIPRYGATGAAICYGITTVIGSVVGTIYTCRVLHIGFPFLSLAKILFCAFGMGGVMHAVLIWNGQLLGYCIAVVGGMSAYAGLCLVVGSWEKEDRVVIGKIKSWLGGLTMALTRTEPVLRK